MAKYNNKTATLKTVTHDSTIINTKEIYVNGKSIEEIVGKTFSFSASYEELLRGITVNGIKGSITGGSLTLFFDESVTSLVHQRASLTINGSAVICPISGTTFVMWNPTDDLSKIYGGITESTTFGVIITFAAN